MYASSSSVVSLWIGLFSLVCILDNKDNEGEREREREREREEGGEREREICESIPFP